MKTIPTLLTTTKDEFIKQMDIFQKYYSRIQLDMCDGNLVPNKTVQIDEIIELLDNKIVIFSPSVEFDFHMMVKDYEKELPKIVKLQEKGMKVNTVLLNAGLQPDIPALSANYSFSIGLDVFPEVKIEDITRNYSLESIPTIQVMTVAPGFQGSPFLPDMLTKIEQLRIEYYKGIIMIDGGVNDVTIPLVNGKKFKPDYLCIGSYLTKTEDLKSRVEELRMLE